MKRWVTNSFILYFLLPVISFLGLLSSSLPAQSKSFAGLWNSTFGHITLEVNGLNVSGLYDDGTVEGSIKGRLSPNREILAGEWFEGQAQGTLVFRILPGGNSFYGNWRKGEDETGGEWIAVRMDKDILSSSATASDYEGEWDTNFGRMALTIEGAKVSGEFKGEVSQGKIEGSIDEKTNRLSANWADNKYRGTLVLNLLRGKKGFSGEWWFRDKTYGGDWYGVRPIKMAGCLAGDCDNGEGIYIWSKTNRYEGEWKDGSYHGIGAAYDDVGNVVNKGLWAKGIFQGIPLSGDCKNGTGKLKLPGGDIYEGEFKECEMSGKGKISFQNGDTYEGEVRKGVAEGNGIYTWAESGGKYSGNFRNGAIHGKGEYEFKTGDRIDIAASRDNTFPEMPAVYLTKKTGYFIYRFNETTVPLYAENPDSGSSEGKMQEVELKYYLVYTADTLEESAIRSYMAEGANVNLEDDFKIEQLSNPETRIHQLADRYRYTLSKTRIYTSGAHYYFSEDKIAVLK